MTTYSRADWGARPATAGPGPLDPARVEGVALHWPAMSKPLTTVAAVKAALRGWQDYHMDTQGWSDIGYQAAVDQAGNDYILRGLRTQSGANGDRDVNERFGAILLILAPGEEPTKAMIATTGRLIAEQRAIFPKSRLVVGHADIRPEPTACPGPAALRLIRSGAFEPNATTQEDDMLTAQEIANIADAVWNYRVKRPGKDTKIATGVALAQAWNRSDATALRQQVAALREAVDRNADAAEIKSMLESLDATIVLSVNSEES